MGKNKQKRQTSNGLFGQLSIFIFAFRESLTEIPMLPSQWLPEPSRKHKSGERPWEAAVMWEF